MKSDEAKQEAKKHLQEYLDSRGINTSRPFRCLNPLHEDRHPSMSYDPVRMRCHCFACGADYDIFDCVSIETGLSGKELFRRVYSLFGTGTGQYADETEKATECFVSDESLSDFFKRCHDDVSKTDYWKRRGLSRKTVDDYNLGYWAEKKRFVIPTGEKSYNARATWDADRKERYLKPKGKFELFNLKSVPSCREPVFVVEGEFDALSVIEAGGNAVALGSSGSSGFVQYLKDNRPEYPLILSLDRDEAGIRAEEKLASELTETGTSFVEYDIACGFKDANEALVNDRDSFIEKVKEAKEEAFHIVEKKKMEEQSEYLKTSALNGLTDFIGEINRRMKGSCTSTGFSGLDEILDGGFYPGFYIIGAVSSLGKTTLALQIADNAAAGGRDVLVFSLEMGKQELVSKSISRLSFQKCRAWNTGDYSFATTTRNLMNGKSLDSKERTDFLNDCIKDYASYAGRIFYHIGIGDIGVEKIRSVIERHIRITGRNPLVIIDYLQIVAPYDMRATDKQNTDKAVVELKRASRDYDIPVFAISSFNRENYMNPVNIASFKESGAIEYTSDVLMALQFKGMDYLKGENGKYEDDKTRAARIYTLREMNEKNSEIPGKAQELQLKILKNRNGRKGSVDLNFHPMFNFFEEPEPSSSNGWMIDRRR